MSSYSFGIRFAHVSICGFYLIYYSSTKEATSLLYQRNLICQAKSSMVHDIFLLTAHADTYYNKTHEKGKCVMNNSEPSIFKILIFLGISFLVSYFWLDDFLVSALIVSMVAYFTIKLSDYIFKENM